MRKKRQERKDIIEIQEDTRIGDYILEKGDKIEVLNEAGPIGQDRKGALYVDWDEETDQWCVFGTETGYAYYCSMDKEDAKEERDRLAKSYGVKAESKKRNTKKRVKESIESDITNSKLNMLDLKSITQVEDFEEFVDEFGYSMEDMEHVLEDIGLESEQKARDIFNWVKENVYIQSSDTLIDINEVPISFQYISVGYIDNEGYATFSSIPNIIELFPSF